MAGLRHNLVFGRGGALGGGYGGGGGGGDPFGAIGGFINSMGWNPELEQAKQLQALKMQEQTLKMQAMQGQLQAQRQEQEAMAGYHQLGEDIVPEAGTQVSTEAQGPGAEQVLGTFAGAPTENDRLLRAMIQSGNPSLLAKAQAQLAPQEPGPQGTVEEIGGQKFTRDVSGNLHPIPTKEPKETSLNDNELFAYVASNGAIKGHTIPEGMTVEQAKATINKKQELQQQRINISAMGREDKRAHITSEGRLTDDPDQAELSIPFNSPRYKVFAASNTVYNHLNQGLEAYKNLMDRFGGDRNRLTAWLTSSANVLKNDPDAVKLFDFLEGPNALALAGLYAGSGTSMRTGPMLAKMLKPSGITRGDNIITMAESKFQPMAELNLGNVTDVGLPQNKFQRQLDEFKELGKKARVLSGVPQRGAPTGPPPPGTKWQRNVKTGEIRAMPIQGQ